MLALTRGGEGTDAEGARLGWRTRTLSSSSLNLGFAHSLFNLLTGLGKRQWRLSQGVLEAAHPTRPWARLHYSRVDEH